MDDDEDASSMEKYRAQLLQASNHKNALEKSMSQSMLEFVNTYGIAV